MINKYIPRPQKDIQLQNCEVKTVKRFTVVFNDVPSLYMLKCRDNTVKYS